MMILMTSKTTKSSTVLPMMMMNSCFASSSGMMPFLIALMKDDSSVSHEDLMMVMNRGINIKNNKLMHLMLMKTLMGDKKDLKVPILEATCDLNGVNCKMEWKMSLSSSDITVF